MLRVRLPEELKADVKAFAEENHRSMNAEIVARLERTIAEDKTATDARSKLAAQRVLSANLTGRPDPVEERFQALEKEIAAIKDHVGIGEPDA